MPRSAVFTDDDVLDAALRAVQRAGAAVTIADVAHALGGPVGSIYHRFDSRTELLGRLWVRCVRHFQEGILRLRDETAPTSTIVPQAAVHVPRFCRDNPAEARALTLYSRQRLIEALPDGTSADVAAVNDDLTAFTLWLSDRHFGSTDPQCLDLLIWATRSGPYGLVRPYLGGTHVPATLDAAVAAQATAIIQSNPDRPHTPRIVPPQPKV